MVQFTGKYKQVKQEKYEDFLKELGVGMLMRKAAGSSAPVIEISETGPGKWKIVSATKMKSIETTFEMNTPFAEKTADGREVETTVTLDGNTWTMHQKNKKSGGKDAKIVREFTDKGIEAQFICGSVVSKCFFERQ